MRRYSECGIQSARSSWYASIFTVGTTDATFAGSDGGSGISEGDEDSAEEDERDNQGITRYSFPVPEMSPLGLLIFVDGE